MREAAERRARPRSVYAARKALTLADVPHTDEPDPLPQPEVRAIVLAYARTGDYDLTADEVGHQRVDVMRCLRRAAAMTMIDYMVEEGTWPNQEPLHAAAPVGRMKPSTNHGKRAHA